MKLVVLTLKIELFALSIADVFLITFFTFKSSYILTCVIVLMYTLDRTCFGEIHCIYIIGDHIPLLLRKQN